MNQPLPSPIYDSTTGGLPARKDFFAADFVAYTTTTTTTTTSSLSKSAYYVSPSSTTVPNSSTTKTSKPKITRTNMPTATNLTVPSSSPSLLPDSKGDLALFGRPSVVAGYNLTAGILIYSAFFLAFLVAVCAATIQRAMFRRQYRQQQQSSSMIESGKRAIRTDDKKDKGGSGQGGRSQTSPPGRRGQGPEMSMSLMSNPPLSKKRSESERALVMDMGPAGGVNYQQRAPVRNYEATRPLQREQSVRSNSQPSTTVPLQNAARQNRDRETRGGVGRRPLLDPRLDYLELDLEDTQDSVDYSSPSLTLSASTQQDAYYSGGFMDAIQDYKDYLSPAISQGHPAIDRVNGMGQPNVSSAQVNSDNKPKTKVAYESYTEYPIPILRSKSTRLPREMRGGSSA